ncbi:MAG: hypothetical protein LC745_01855 [Planctomycetia bacterium]|nr:hypothetical protein [Planctomycetia bacterium]
MLIKVFERIGPAPSPHDFRERWIPVSNRHSLFVDPVNERVLIRPSGQVRWRKAVLPV